MDVPTGFLSAEQSRKILGVKDNTLRLWAKSGHIQSIRNGEKGSHRYYNVREYLKRQGDDIVREEIKSSERRKICYCRVSTRNQRDDLERQISFLRGRYPNHEIIKDIGSGINFKRKGLKTILECAIKGSIEEVVVAYKDRLCRFGFDLVKWIVEEFSRGKIVVLNQSNCSPEQEVVNDVLSILNVFSAKINGLRKYHTKIKDEFKEPQLVFEE
jgi:putative resolvase